MPFHRFVDPTYYGSASFPGSLFGETYDRINVISGGTGGSGSANADGAKAGGPTAGTYFVAFGEDGTSLNTNRGFRALSENTDYLDDVLHQDVATLTSTSLETGHGGSSSINLNGSVDNIYVSSDGGSDVTDLFSVTDTANRPIFINGSRVVPISIVGAVIGTGFSSANPLTVNFNETIPTTQAFRVHYGIRDNYVTLPEDALVNSSILRAVRVLDGADLAVDDASLTAVALGTMRVKSGGVGNPITTAQEALDNIDSRLTKLRGFTAVISDGVTSFGGDIEGASLDSLIETSSPYRGGYFVIKEGAYTLSAAPANWTQGLRLLGSSVSDNSANLKVTIDVGRAADLLMVESVVLDAVTLKSASTSSRYTLGAGGHLTMRGYATYGVDAGALDLSSSSFFDLDGITLEANATLLVNYGLEVSGLSSGRIRNCTLAAVPSAAPALDSTLGFHTATAGTGSGVVVENCTITGSAGHALHISAYYGKIIFRNCKIDVTGSSDVWAVFIEDALDVTFENCTISASQGQAIRVDNAGVRFRDCYVYSGSDTTLANPQLIRAYGRTAAGDTPMVYFENVDVGIGAANVRIDAPTLPIVEIGGGAGTQQDGRAMVNGMNVYLNAGTHNAATVHLWSAGNTAEGSNFYDGIMLDAGATSVSNLGTRSTDVAGAGVGALIEIGANFSQHKTEVGSVSIRNFIEPATSHARTILKLADTHAKSVSIDGAPGSAAGVYQDYLVYMVRSVVEHLDIFPDNGTASDQVLYLNTLSHVRAGRYHRRGIAGSGTGEWIEVGAQCSLQDFLVYCNVNLSTGQQIIRMPNGYGECNRVYVYLDGTSTNEIVQFVGDFNRFDHGTLYWENVAPDQIINGTSNGSSNLGNRFIGGGGATPAQGVAGSNRIDANNVAFTDVVNAPAW